MTLNVDEQVELIQEIRRCLPPKGKAYRRWKSDVPGAYQTWTRCWNRLCSSELQSALRSSLAKRYPDAVDDFDDVIQDVLVIFYRKIFGGYDVDKAGSRGVLPYLFKIAGNEMKRRFRAAGKIPIQLDEFIELAADKQRTEKTSEYTALLDELESQLTNEEKLVLRGKREESTLKEIGQQLGTESTSKVDHVVRRIRRKARRILGDHDEQND